MTQIELLRFNALPDAGPTNACFQVIGTSDKCAQVVKVLPSGRRVGRFVNTTERDFMNARYGTNGTIDIQIYGDEVGPDVGIWPGQSIFVIEGQTGRWIPVRPQDNHLIFSLTETTFTRNPLTSAPPAGLTFETFTDTLRNASPAMKVAAVVAVAAFGWYLLK